MIGQVQSWESRQSFSFSLSLVVCSAEGNFVCAVILICVNHVETMKAQKAFLDRDQRGSGKQPGGGYGGGRFTSTSGEAFQNSFWPSTWQ